VNEMDKKRLVIWKRKLLRRIHGPVVEQGIWRIRTDQELKDIHKYLDVLENIEKGTGMDWTCSKNGSGRKF
jgi:hypothetical protein